MSPTPTKTLSIIQAMDSLSFFGQQFKAASWRPWRSFLKAAFALPMDEAELELYRHHTQRTVPPTKPSRYVELVCGRRGGKSRILALVAVYLAAIMDHRPYLVAGETAVVAIIAADRKQAKVIFGYIRGLLQSVPALKRLIADELAETIRLTNSVTIEIHTASIGAPRGRTFLAVLADECAFWESDTDASNPDVEIINAVRPGLTTLPYSMLLVASSPYAKRGLLYQNYAKYFGHDEAPVLVWQGASWEMNPQLEGDPLIAEMYEEDPERAEAEFGAHFRSDVTSFITREAVEAVLARGIRELPPAAGITYLGHVDPSGGSADSMTLAIAHMENGVAVLDLVREIKPPFSPDQVVQEFAGLLKAYGISRVTGDAYAGLWPRERFEQHGIGYEVSEINTSQIYLGFLPALNSQRVRLLDNPRLVGQLVNLERRTSRQGRDAVSHPPGQHDDVANAACGALVRCLSDHRPALIQRSAMLNEQGRGQALPISADGAFMVMGVDSMGQTACAYYLRNCYYADRPPLPLLLVDFDTGQLNVQALSWAVSKLGEMRQHVRLRHSLLPIFVDDLLLEQARQSNLFVQSIPPELQADAATLALKSASNVLLERVKIAVPAFEKAKIHPLGAVLDFKAGDADDSILRTVILQGIALALDKRPLMAEPLAYISAM